MEKAHGRIERRSLQANQNIARRDLFPHAEQAFRLERTTTDIEGRPLRHEIAYGLTSCLPEEADEARLLELVRNQWSIENRVHWVRDVTFDEDRSQIRTGHGPRVMATLRNVAISLLRLTGHPKIPRAIRGFSANRSQVLALIGA